MLFFMSALNLTCLKCDKNFNADVGNVLFKFSFREKNNRPTFEKELACPHCGKLTMDDVYLTETGQAQLTAIFLKS